MSETKKLTDSELDAVAGGMVMNATGMNECNPTKPWEVIHNNTGEILGRYATQDEACYAAGQYKSGSKYDKMLVSQEQVEYLRKHPQVFQ